MRNQNTDASTAGKAMLSTAPAKKSGRIPTKAEDNSKAKKPKVKSEMPSVIMEIEAHPELKTTQWMETTTKSIDEGKKDKTTAIETEDVNSIPMVGTMKVNKTQKLVARNASNSIDPCKLEAESAKRDALIKDGAVILKPNDELEGRSTTEKEPLKDASAMEDGEEKQEDSDDVEEELDMDEDELIGMEEEREEEEEDEEEKEEQEQEREREEAEEEGEEGGEDEGEGEEEDEEIDEEEEKEEEEEGEQDYLEAMEGPPPELQELRPVTEKMKRRKLEVFIGGLNRDAVEEDIKEALQYIGEIMEVRLLKIPQSNQNKGYGFVRFSSPEQAVAAAALGRVQIRGKSCAVVPSEDDDTLYLGNINKSWNKDKVVEKLKEYEIEGVEEITLVKNPHTNDMNLGIAYLEFSSHGDAVKAHKRLSKRDAIFGLDKPATIAWATNPSDSSDEIMAKVKSVFVDGMPSSWSDKKAREHFSKYGEIERVVFSRNMASATGKDFAFVNYVTSEGAMACVEAFKNMDHLMDGETEVKLIVQLSKPGTKGRFLKRSSHGGSDSHRAVKKIRGGYVWYSLGNWRDSRKPPRRFNTGRGSRRALQQGLTRVYDDHQVSRVVRPCLVANNRYLSRERVRGRPLAEVRGDYSGRGGGFPYQQSRHARSYSPPPAPPRRVAPRDGYRSRIVEYSEVLPPRPSRRPSHPGRLAPLVALRGENYLRTASRAPVYERETSPGYSRPPHDVSELRGGLKRPYSSMGGDDPAYYETGARGGGGGYPKGRTSTASVYANPLPPYLEPYRGTQGRIRNAGSGRTMEPSVYESQQSSAAALAGGSRSSLYSRTKQGYGSGPGETVDYRSSAAEAQGSSLHSSSSVYGGRSGVGGYSVSGSGAYY